MAVRSIDLGFRVTDGDQVELRLHSGAGREDLLDLTFREDLRQDVSTVTRVRFSGVVAFLWQAADPVLQDGERRDGTFEVLDSAWLAEHVRQNMLGPGEYRHLKLNFNLDCVVEVITSGCRVLERTDGPPR